MIKTEDTSCLVSKIEELVTIFKKDYDFNKLEASLQKTMYDFLAPIIQESIQSLMIEPLFLSLLKVIGGKRCLKLEGYSLVEIRILDGRNVLVSSPYFFNRVRKKSTKKKQKRSKGNNLDCHLGLSRIGMVSRYSGNLGEKICKMAVLCPSAKVACRVLSDEGIKIDEKTLRKIVRDVGQIGLEGRGSISISDHGQIEGGTLVIGTDGGRIRERIDKKEKRGYYRLERTSIAPAYRTGRHHVPYRFRREHRQKFYPCL